MCQTCQVYAWLRPDAHNRIRVRPPRAAPTSRMAIVPQTYPAGSRMIDTPGERPSTPLPRATTFSVCL